MGTDTTKWTVQNYLDSAPLVGLPSSNFVPQSLRSQCGTVAKNSVPPSAPKTFPVVCEASLIIRGIFYFKSNPGDCGSPTQLNLTDANLTQISGAAAQSGVKIAASLAGAGSGIASMAGAVLPGIGVAVQAITTIFANHAKAVATEEAVICNVSQVINQVIPHYDAQVRSGQISPSTAYAGMQTFLNQVNGQLAQIEKTCDAACVYQAILKAHAAFVQMYYPQIAPASAASHAPGAAPSSITAPGGVVTVGGSATSAKPTAVAPTHVVGVQDGPPEPVIYPLFGEQQTGTVYILYKNKLTPVNYLSNSAITPGYHFAAGTLPPGYSWNNIHWVPTVAELPYPVSNTLATSDEYYLIAALVAIILFVFFVMRKGTA